jgi:hypothetical protein
MESQKVGVGCLIFAGLMCVAISLTALLGWWALFALGLVILLVGLMGT